MSDYNSKTEDSVSSRFEHKSQGMRTQTMNEKKVAEESVQDLLAQLEQDDKTIRIESPQRTSQNAAASSGSSSSTAQNYNQQKNARASSVNAAQQRPQAASNQKQTSGSRVRQAASPGNGQQTSAASSKVSNVFENDLPDSTASNDGLGVSVFVSKSDIPAYEIGLNSDDYYIPAEIKSGKVSKISADQVDELENKAGAKKKSSKNSRNQKKKKKMTPAQKAVRAVIWVAAWLIVFLIAFVCYRITYNVFYDIAVNPDSTSTIEYTVTADATDESVYEDLCELGVMNCTEFIYKLRAKVFDAEYIEGTYTISDGYNIEKIINILAGYDYSSDDD